MRAKICRVYNLSESVNRRDLLGVLKDLKYRITEDHTEKGETIIIEKSRAIGIIFAHGSIALWNFDRENSEELLKKIQPTLRSPYQKTYFDEFEYQKDSAFSMKNELIKLKTIDKEILLAISYSLAQSVELERLEELISEILDPILKITQELGTYGQISISARNLKKFIGTILLRKYEINLKKNLLDVPDYFWEKPESENYYTKVRHYLEITDRSENLNHKLRVLQDSLEILRDEKNALHNAKLEVIIVILIIFEIIMAFLQ